MQDFLHFTTIFAIFDEFSEFCSTFGTHHFEKSSNTAKSLGKNEEKSFNYSITFNGHFWNQKISQCSVFFTFAVQQAHHCEGISPLPEMLLVN